MRKIITDMNCLECRGSVIDYEFEIDDEGFICCPHCGGNETEVEEELDKQ